MATEQSFSIALLLTIAYVLWRTMRADMLKKDAKYDVLEGKFNNLQTEFRTWIQQHHEDNQKLMIQQSALMERTAEALEQNNLVLEAIRPLVNNSAK